MATLKRPSNSKDKDIVGRFKPDARCKKHPKHRQSPGVCSLCLRHKLSQLSSSSSSSSHKPTSGSSCDSSSASSSLSSYYSSNSASSSASPTHPNFPFSIFLLNAKHAGLVKSRSMALVPRTGEGEGAVHDHHNKTSIKKTGFWSKLLHPKSKRSMEDKATKLLHTTSLIETVT